MSTSNHVPKRKAKLVRDRPHQPRSRLSFQEYLSQSVNGTSLAAFRIAVGIVMALEGYALLVPHDAAITYGTPLEHYYTGPDIRFHFPYEGIEWLPMLPSAAMYVLACLLIIAGTAMAIGLCYRASATTVFGIWAYLFVVESTRTYWQSHYYLELLVTFLLMWMPAANRWSLDALISTRKSPPGSDGIGSIPFWPLFLLRWQLVIAYFYAGVSKLNADWLLDAAPVRWFLAEPHVLKPYAPYLSPSQLDACHRLITSPAFAYFLSYTGAAFDLAIGFLLLCRRTRVFGFALMFIFHATNHLLIFDDIGWFPVVGMATATIFLEPSWPERFWNWIRRPRLKRPDRVWAVAGALACPVVGVLLGWRSQDDVRREDGKFQLGRFVVPCVILWLAWQAALPLRHYLINGDARFTYEGLSFSWRLKADTRQAIGHALTLQDDAIVSRSGSAGSQIHWNEWKGEPTIYRQVRPSHIVWPRLPEFLVVLEPGIGERIVYNPFSGRNVSHSDQVSRQRLDAFWRATYGRRPVVHRPLARADAVRKVIDAYRARGLKPPEVDRLANLLPDLDRLKAGNLSNQQALALVQDFYAISLQLQSAAPDILRPILRQTYPFLLQGEPFRPAPFFIVDDHELTSFDDEGFTKITRNDWIHAAETGEPLFDSRRDIGGSPLVIYFAGLGTAAKTLLPQAYITDIHLKSSLTPVIRWNSTKDMSPSKYMHTSGQAFYLRRYARRVAELWSAEYGRRPRVFARTAVSYNHRKHQPLVDPKADLAAVPVKWFQHNAWIVDLEAPRIPRAALNHQADNAQRRRDKQVSMASSQE